MTYDGARALIVGDYVTPQSGRYAGELGPWSMLVELVGIPPRSTGMKATFVAFGLAWLLSAVAFATRRSWSNRALAITAAATLWYAPVGTLVALLQLAGLLLMRARRSS